MHPEQPTTSAPRYATAREMLAILFRRRVLVLGLFGVTTVTVLVLSFSTPTTYLSSGRVLIKRGEKESALTSSRRYTGDWEEEMGSEIEVVKSGVVMDRARALLAEEAGPGRTPPKLDPSGIDVEVRGRSNVVGIGYMSGDPVTARQVCDALLRAYVEYRQNDFSLAVPKDFFEDELGQVQKDLDYWTQRRRSYAEHSQVVDLPLQRSADISRLSVLRQQQSVAEADLAEARVGRQKLLELHESGSFDQPSFSMLFQNEVSLMELKRRVVDQEFHVASLRERMRDDAPELMAAHATLDTLRAMARREIRTRVAVSTARIELLEARLQVMREEGKDLEQSLAEMPGKALTIFEMDRRIDLLTRRYSELAEAGNTARITENTSPARNAVLLAGASPAVLRSARDYVRLALAPAFSLVVGIGLAFFIEGLDVTVRTARHAEEALGVPVLATLSDRRRRNRPNRERSAKAVA